MVAAEHEVRLRVRYAETDTMQVVHYSKYYVWFEAGRIELLRSLGVVYKDLEEQGMKIPVVESHANYLFPARFDDEVLVKTRITKVGNTSLRFENEVFRLPDMKPLCTGHTVHVLVNSEGVPTRIPPEVAAKLRGESAT